MEVNEKMEDHNMIAVFLLEQKSTMLSWKRHKKRGFSLPSIYRKSERSKSYFYSDPNRKNEEIK